MKKYWILWWVVAVVFTASVGSVSSVESRELDSVLQSLRLRGYDLFCNAILTSDLQIQLANDSLSFTFFAPIDASLFALDMTLTASSYTDILRFHIVPRRLSLPHLRLLPDGYSLPTLLPNHRLQLTRRPPSNTVSVSGVPLAFPGLFHGRDVAVHGLAGILTPPSNDPSAPPLPHPIRSADRQFDSPRNTPSSPENQPPVLGPVPRRAPAASPVNGRVDSPDREPHAAVHPPENLGDSPVASPPKYPNSAISLPPEGYLNAPSASPEALDGISRCVNGDVRSMKESMGGYMQCYAA